MVMKKICIVTSSHGRNDIRLFQKHTQTLANNGYFVYYVVADGESDENGNNYVITSLGLPKATKLSRLFSLSYRLSPKLLNLDADVFQICDPELIRLGRILRKAGKKVIFDSVEDWEGYFREKINPVIGYIISKIVTFILKKNLKEYERVLVMSPNIQRRLDNYAPGKVEFVSNYPIISNHPTQGLSLDEYLTNARQFIYCGTVYGFSVQEEVVKSLHELSYENSKLSIVGSIANKRKNSISMVGEKYVEFIPWVTKTELLERYHNSICGVVIFKYTPVCCGKEGQMGSNKIFEYMLEGLPVICTDFSLWKELIIDKYKCGICVNPNDYDDIKNAVKYIMDNKEEAYAMGKRAREAVLNEFNWEMQASRYLSVIESLI